MEIGMRFKELLDHVDLESLSSEKRAALKKFEQISTRTRIPSIRKFLDLVGGMSLSSFFLFCSQDDGVSAENVESIKEGKVSEVAKRYLKYLEKRLERDLEDEDIIKALAERKNWTVERFSSEAGIPVKTAKDIFENRGASRAWSTVCKICLVFSIDIWEFYWIKEIIVGHEEKDKSEKQAPSAPLTERPALSLGSSSKELREDSEWSGFDESEPYDRWRKLRSLRRGTVVEKSSGYVMKRNSLISPLKKGDLVRLRMDKFQWDEIMSGIVEAVSRDEKEAMVKWENGIEQKVPMNFLEGRT